MPYVTYFRLKELEDGRIEVTAKYDPEKRVIRLTPSLNHQTIDFSRCKRQSVGSQESLKAFAEKSGLVPFNQVTVQFTSGDSSPRSPASAASFVPFDVPQKRVDISPHGHSPRPHTQPRPRLHASTGTGLGKETNINSI